MPEQQYRDLQDLPPSAKLVYKVLEYENELSYSEIVEETRLPDSTVTNALTKLQYADLVERRFRSSDARNRYYSPK